MAQLLAVLSVVCFILGGMFLGIGLTLHTIKRARQELQPTLTVYHQDAVA